MRGPDSVPLAAHPEGCAYRARMIQALDAARIRWRVAYTGPGISGLQNAVINGLGVSALTRYTMLPGMRALTETDGFPPLAEIRVGLFYKHPRLSDAGIRLVNHIIARLDEAGFGLERYWHYFPPAALHALEWGHYFGLPSWVTRALTGRWILAPTRWNLALTEHAVRKHAENGKDKGGTYTWYVARKR